MAGQRGRKRRSGSLEQEENSKDIASADDKENVPIDFEQVTSKPKRHTGSKFKETLRTEDSEESFVNSDGDDHGNENHEEPVDGMEGDADIESDRDPDAQLRNDQDVEAPPSARTIRGRKERSHLSEAGVIKQIYVENFMCHRKLKVDLNRNVNFIHGQNGSGKSAILAAIQICLGANARRTHRARNLKDLVRKDTLDNSPSTAKVRVTLLNKENDGFKYDVYGETITVERSISLNGGYNGYRLLDQNMKERSRAKKDLDEMLDTLNIQVENPVAVLDQEEAKKFLMGKAEDKYNFFMKATELERVDRTYASTVDTVHEMIQLNERTREGLKQQMEQVEVLKKKYEEHIEVDRLEDKVHQMNIKLAWSLYHHSDSEYNQAIQNMSAFQEKAVKKELELSQAEELLSSPRDSEDEKRRRMDELLIEAQEQAALKRELESQLLQAQAPYKAKERELQSLKRDQAKAEKRLKSARQCLQTARDQMLERVGAAESEDARRTALLKKTEEDLAVAREKVNELRQAVSTAYRSFEEVEPHVQHARSKSKTVLNKMKSAGVTIKELESSSGESLAIWGRNVAKVRQLVDRATRAGKFQGPVEGPIGSYLKVAPGKEDFASVAELAVNFGNLDRFIVTNDNDRRIFQDIRKQAGCSTDCGVFQIRTSSRYRIPTPPSYDGIETVASVLKIESDLVFNCLVDNARIDQIVIARSRKLSEDCLLVQNDNEYRIRDQNISTVYCLPRGDQWSVKKGSLAIFSNEKKLRQTIGVDKSAALQAAIAEESQLREEHNILLKEEAELEDKHTRYTKEWNSAKKAMLQNDAVITELQSKIEEIKSDIASSANITIDTSDYEDDVREAEEAVENLKETEEKISNQLEELQPKIDDLKVQVDDCAMRNMKVLEEIDVAEKDLTQLVEAHTQQKDNIEKKRQKVLKYREIMKKYQEKVDAAIELRSTYLVSARRLTFESHIRSSLSQEHPDPTQHNGLSSNNKEEIAQRVPTDEELEEILPEETEHDFQYYEVRLTKLKKKLATERQKKKLSKDGVILAYQKYQQAKGDLAARTRQVTEIDEKIQNLSADLKERKRRWKQFRNHLSLATNMKFSEMLSINGYAGELTFSHDEKTLDLGVQKNSSHSQGVSKDVKALSGGERSYTTMCLLVALGETLETPFRVLDEFDVFLDTEARKLTIKALIHVAKKMEHRQFIFITPQDLSSVQPDPQLKILKLTPPQRHINAGGPSQQTLDFAAV